MRRWRSDAGLRYSSPTPKIILLGVGVSLAAALIRAVEDVYILTLQLLRIHKEIDFSVLNIVMLAIPMLVFAAAIIEYITRGDTRSIRYIIIRRLCAYHYGNPLRLRDGELEPRVTVVKTDQGYTVRIESASSIYERVASLETVISDALRNRYGDYAVVAKTEDVAGRYVDYQIADVVSMYRQQTVYRSIDDVQSGETGRLHISERVFIDYTKVLNSSALVVGGTRSGKTTGIISAFLLPLLKAGPDEHESKIIVVDPKSAELSQCAHVLSPDIHGDVEHILDAIKDYNEIRIKRQQYINEKGRERGKAVKWYEIGMKPCLLFLDEWVSLVGLFPAKASKDKPDYCLPVFQMLIRQIATQGASAGCFLVISTAQASVGVGGLDSVVNNACGIRIMFKPKRDEAAFLWSSKQLEVMKEWNFMPGDAWFSIDDGIHNQVGFVKFPKLDDDFGEYKILSDLLDSYYGGAACVSTDAPQEKSDSATESVSEPEKTS